jgi:spermidine/putrescine transport system ATP-binding protein
LWEWDFTDRTPAFTRGWGVLKLFNDHPFPVFFRSVMLELINIKKAYQSQPLLRGVSATVSVGETVCLLGPSGSGKSTLLRIIAGLEKPDQGQVCWDGEDLADLPVHKRGFGLVFQDYALFPHLTVAENVAFGLQMQNLKGAKANPRVAETLEMVNMAGFGDRQVTDLSGGEQQRVALARAMAPRPRLLMFDEPLGALDRNLREQLMEELRRILRESRVPAIYVTHDQEEAFALADRVLLLHDGMIIRSGTPELVWTDPGSVWAAQFLDAGNVISGIVLSTSPLLKVDTPVGVLNLECKRYLKSAQAGIVTVPARDEVAPVSARDEVAPVPARDEVAPVPARDEVAPVPPWERHGYSKGDRIDILITRRGVRQDDSGQVGGVVVDVIFRQDGFKVTLENGLTFYLPTAPHLGEHINLAIPASGIICLP